MDWTLIVASTLASGLVAYLGVALLRPEWFA